MLWSLSGTGAPDNPESATPETWKRIIRGMSDYGNQRKGIVTYKKDLRWTARLWRTSRNFQLRRQNSEMAEWRFSDGHA